MYQNTQIELAWKFIEQTGTNIFLTGKAGTGKTTFLRRLKESSPKRMIVVAPTGVAAINAGGVTIHSFFQLPFGPYLPAIKQGEAKMQFSKEKRNIIRSLDLLVIDEISMVRADLLDAVDDVLRHYANRNKPFGGVQLLMIGDLQQLAPVVKQQEWELLGDCYASPYFFDSKALRSTDYLTIELKHIYRQTDNEFIEVLNRVRDNTADSIVLQKLNSRYIPNFRPDQNEGYITLTSHNQAAKQLNDSRLDELTTAEYCFDCQIEGVFPEYLYPTESQLRLKEGAQVMFIKNDISGLHRYYNGKIGQITHIDDNGVEVTIDDYPQPIAVEPAEWANAKYVINKTTQEIEEQIDGTFQQLPLKTAWAITIHKSQGLTFDKAIIDAAQSFSHGQVYVALSRCRSFEGLVLSSPISAQSIINDTAVKAFTDNAEANEPTESTLSLMTRAYIQSLLLDMFNFAALRSRTGNMMRLVKANLEKSYPKLTRQWSDVYSPFISEIFEVGQRFEQQIVRIIQSTPDLSNAPLLTERIVKGQEYFGAKCEEYLKPLSLMSNVEVDNKETRKQLNDALKLFNESLNVKTALMTMDCSNGFSIHDCLQAKAKASLREEGLPKKKRERAEPTAKTESETNDVENTELFELLRSWRNDLADELNIPPYCIMRQKTLVTICNTLPRNDGELAAIKGIGRQFMEKYATEVEAIVNDWIDDRIG